MPTELVATRADDGGGSSTGAGRPAIEVRGLTKRFGDVVAVDGIDLSVERATVFGLLGPNGAGKTTIIRILTTILAADRGSASILGIDVSRDPQAVRERIGLAGQYAAVDRNLTGRENLELVGRLTHLPRRIARERAGELLDGFRLSDAADRRVSAYSGGMRRRLDLAAALVHRPPVLFLDEPTSGLDPHSRNDLWAIIGNLVDDGTTVLLTTQYLEEADRLADRIAVVNLGQKVAEGTSTELKRSFGNTVIEIELADPADAGRARQAMEGVGAVDVQADAGTLHLTVADGARAVIGVARALDRAQLDPSGFSVREPTLDDVFLALTGHTTGEGPSDRPEGSSDRPEGSSDRPPTDLTDRIDGSRP